jgi:hypothetical protein
MQKKQDKQDKKNKHQQKQDKLDKREWITLWQSKEDPRKTISVAVRGKMLDEKRNIVIVRYPLSMLQEDKTGRYGYGYQAFYQSSGANAKQSVWYPFDGITVSIGQSPYWITKVIYTSFASRYDEKSKPSYKRFGCCLFMFISSLLSSTALDPSNLKEMDRKKYNEYLAMPAVVTPSSVLFQKVVFIPALDESKDINLFVGKAISYNYLKGVEYKAGFHGDKLFDYRKIYKGEKYPFFTGHRFAILHLHRPMVTRCEDRTEYIMDFMLSHDHNNTMYKSYFDYLPGKTYSFMEKRVCDRIKQDPEKAFEDGASLLLGNRKKTTLVKKEDKPDKPKQEAKPVVVTAIEASKKKKDNNKRKRKVDDAPTVQQPRRSSRVKKDGSSF